MRKFVLLSIIALFTACNFEANESSVSFMLGVEDKTFARMGDDGTLEKITDNVFEQGEEVHMVLINAGPFKKGEDGLNWFEMNLEVLDASGKVILHEKELLGEGGHIDLENNMAASPFATFFNTKSVAPGEYTFRLVIYDKLGSGKASQSSKFTIVAPSGDRLMISDHFFGRINEQGEQVSNPDGVFDRGENVYFVLRDAGPFQVGEDGMHWVEMDMQVKDEMGTVVFHQDNLFDGTLHKTLEYENNIIPLLYATFTPGETPAGTYTYVVTLHDKVGIHSTTRSENFVLN